jgi:hypothetical protein
MMVFADLPDGLSRNKMEALLRDKLLAVRMVLFFDRIARLAGSEA